MLNVQHHTQPTHILHDAAIMLSEGDGCDVAVTAHPWWLKTWFDAFHAGSTGTDACVVSVRDESDQLLAVLPLIRTCTTTGSILHWMGGGIACSDGITPYVRDSLNPQIRSSVMAAAARYLISMRRDSELRWDSLEMDGIIEGDLGMRQWIDSLRHEGCGVHSWSRMHVWRRQIVGDWEIGLASCSKTTRRGYRKSLQTLAGDEFVLHVVTDHDSEQSWSTAMATLIDLHQSRWNAEDQPGSFADPAMQRLMDGLWTGLRDFRTLIHVAATSDASSSPKTSGGERSKRRRSRQKRKLETNLQNQHDAAIQHQCTGTPNGDLQHGMRLVILRHTDKPIAAELQLIGTSPSGKCLSSYSSGMTPDAADIQPGRILQASTLRHAHDSGFGVWDFMRGDEPYKARMSASPTPIGTVRITPPGLRGQIGDAAWQTGFLAKQWLRRQTGRTEIGGLEI